MWTAVSTAWRWSSWWSTPGALSSTVVDMLFESRPRDPARRWCDATGGKKKGEKTPKVAQQASYTAGADTECNAHPREGSQTMLASLTRLLASPGAGRRMADNETESLGCLFPAGKNNPVGPLIIMLAVEQSSLLVEGPLFTPDEKRLTAQGSGVARGPTLQGPRLRLPRTPSVDPTISNVQNCLEQSSSANCFSCPWFNWINRINLAIASPQ